MPARFDRLLCGDLFVVPTDCKGSTFAAIGCEWVI
jgi:hypothetical protein